jgi:2'-5' RNA ligase
MHGIITLLDPPHYSQVENIWQDLEQHCGLSGVRVTPLPHFSWQIADEYDLQSLRPVLKEICEAASPFTVLTTGLGVFSGGVPVIYIPVVKNTRLILLHDLIWSATSEVSRQRNPFYSPDMWLPHITLAYGDVDQEKLRCAMSHLAFNDYNWEIPIDHLTLVYQTEGQEGWLRMRFDFGGA